MEEKTFTTEELFSNSLVKEGMDSPGLTEINTRFSTPDMTGQIQSCWFDGIRIGFAECNLKKDMHFEWTSNLDLVTQYFNLRGNTSTATTVYGHEYPFGNYQHNIFYSSESRGIIKSYDTSLITFMVQYRTEKFIELTRNSNEALQQFGSLIHLGNPCTLSPQNLYIDGTIVHTIEQMRNCPYVGGIKQMYLLSKCLELLVLQADASHKIHSSNSRFLKSATDKESIIYAREYLLNHMEQPPTLTDLARIVGINTFKLKNGFKEMFGNTVFGYLTDKRLEMAATEISKKEKSISEIALDMGYSSVQHFSKAYKKKFGTTPRNGKK
ncbi:AraC family transcriptional regulator [Chitinophaga sp. sic0106]|uniref:helix-turn-helix domain-containing protein n=1 Tax=Chitinophaga sp. sic0106 TaxID=2854785 RepID=UPI001C46CF62|nr:AraC family transcriptional regulator [Chitinophaga sp. sic0106]MBV7529873.1 AraC family transcriptional regulator [Chitinophaga sp. sic0106]